MRLVNSAHGIWNETKCTRHGVVMLLLAEVAPVRLSDGER